MFTLKYTKQLLLYVVVMSISPLLLNLIGVDLSTDKIVTASTEHVNNDYEFHRLRGAFNHTLLEWTSFCLAFFTGILAFVHFGVKKSLITPIIGVSLFWAGSMDAFHTLVADRLIDLENANSNFVPFTWAISRMFNALIPLIGAVVLLIDSEKLRNTKLIGFSTLFFGCVAYATIYFSASAVSLPQTQFPDSLITRPWDIFPLIFFLVAGVVVYPKLHKLERSYFSFALWVSIIPNIFAQLHMAFGSSELFDNGFNIGHFLKIISYLVPFLGMVLDYIYIQYEHQTNLDRVLAEVHTNQMLTEAIDSAAIVAVTNKLGQITKVNDLFVNLSQYEEKDLIGKDHRIINSGEHSKEFWINLWRTISSGKTWKGEIKNRAKDGSYYWVDSTIFPFKNHDGSIEKYIAIRYDITKRKELEESLLKSEERLKLSLETSETALWDWDIETDHFFYNRQFYELVQHPKSDVKRDIGGFKSFIHEDDLELFDNLIGWHINGNSDNIRSELRLRSGTGDFIWIFFVGKIVSYNDDQSAQRMVGTIVNIDARKKMEERLVHSEKEAQKANIAKSDFLANMSHEIRTPMNGVLGMTSLLEMTSLDDEQTEFVSIIKNSGSHLINLINDILDYSKIEAGHLQLEILPFSIELCVEEAFDLFQVNVESKNVDMLYCIDSNVPEMIEGDVTRLRQVLVNLISNAVKFTETGHILVHVYINKNNTESMDVGFDVG